MESSFLERVVIALLVFIVLFSMLHIFDEKREKKHLELEVLQTEAIIILSERIKELENNKPYFQYKIEGSKLPTAYVKTITVKPNNDINCVEDET